MKTMGVDSPLSRIQRGHQREGAFPGSNAPSRMASIPGETVTTGRLNTQSLVRWKFLKQMIISWNIAYYLITIKGADAHHADVRTDRGAHAHTHTHTGRRTVFPLFLSRLQSMLFVCGPSPENSVIQSWLLESPGCQQPKGKALAVVGCAFR